MKSLRSEGRLVKITSSTARWFRGGCLDGPLMAPVERSDGHAAFLSLSLSVRRCASAVYLPVFLSSPQRRRGAEFGGTHDYEKRNTATKSDRGGRIHCWRRVERDSLSLARKAHQRSHHCPCCRRSHRRRFLHRTQRYQAVRPGRGLHRRRCWAGWVVHQRHRAIGTDATRPNHALPRSASARAQTHFRRWFQFDSPESTSTVVPKIVPAMLVGMPAMNPPSNAFNAALPMESPLLVR